MRVKGGHAVMLRVQLPDAVSQAANEWVAARPEFRTPVTDAHITVVFVGRDLNDAMHDDILRVARSVDYLIPERLQFQGRFSMFGGRRDHLVGLLIPDDRLNFLRKSICDRLRDCDIVPERTFGSFTPHFTLAKGLPGDGGIPRTIYKEFIPITEMSIKLGKLYMSVQRKITDPYEMMAHDQG